ncbi:hypothetical protein KDL21_01150 [Pseudomonas syringae pv. syringae]|uniref:hypothetical protein n=1 Tax=Pseudomonas syringae TaxID=317 RepID=UPI002341FAF9|nr:hypothetical protein [Pseudomonas syringae]MDC3739627.1 hypothetical protein [Pseudomonas syringae pv. syringae]
MSDTKWSHMVAIVAIIGSVAGSMMTSYQQIVTVKIQVEKEASALEAANARAFLDQFTEKTEPVTVALNSLMLLPPGGGYDIKDFKTKANDLSEKAAALMPYVNSELYVNLQAVAVTASEYADEPDAEKRKPIIAQLSKEMKTFMESYFKLRDQLLFKVPVPKK